MIGAPFHKNLKMKEESGFPYKGTEWIAAECDVKHLTISFSVA